jgi:hypothetical protein
LYNPGKPNTSVLRTPTPVRQGVPRPGCL